MEAETMKSVTPISGLTVGRDCHYFVGGISEPFAAKIAKIHDHVTGDCTLAVLDHDGHWRTVRTTYAPVHTAGCWSWMARVP